MTHARQDVRCRFGKLLIVAGAVCGAMLVGRSVLHSNAAAQQSVTESGAQAAAAFTTPAGNSRGLELYRKNCSICHGENGDGLGKFAYLMNPRPRNFRSGDFKLATTQNQVPSDDDLLRTISRGMPGSAMPPWAHLPQADLEAIIEAVRAFHVDEIRAQLAGQVAEGSITPEQAESMLAQRTQPGPPLVVPPEPEFDSVRWFRGRSVYLEACASCHGVEGHPVPEAVKFDSEGYPVPPRSFVSGIFKGGSEGHQLYSRIVKGLKGTPMPGYEGAYSDDETWDLIHYVQSLAREGAQERAQLREGTFVAARIDGALPPDPLDGAWGRARPLYVGLTPLWWTENRIEGLTVQALHNGEELAIRLSWIDATSDTRAVRHDEFRDAVALQFSLTPDPPFYMGEAGRLGGVNLWMWKADREQDLEGGYQDVGAAFTGLTVDRYPEQAMPPEAIPTGGWALRPITEHDPTFVTAWGAGNLVAQPDRSTPVESLVARGPGTLSGLPLNIQRVDGQAVHDRGVWHVQLQRRMSFPDATEDDGEREFRSGDYLPVSFAIWNGSAGDRDGKKNISIWQKLVIQ
jgi:mono/diheme cytochrome c family protein